MFKKSFFAFAALQIAFLSLVSVNSIFAQANSYDLSEKVATFETWNDNDIVVSFTNNKKKDLESFAYIGNTKTGIRLNGTLPKDVEIISARLILTSKNKITDRNLKASIASDSSEKPKAFNKKNPIDGRVLTDAKLNFNQNITVDKKAKLSLNLTDQIAELSSNYGKLTKIALIANGSNTNDFWFYKFGGNTKPKLEIIYKNKTNPNEYRPKSEKSFSSNDGNFKVTIPANATNKKLAISISQNDSASSTLPSDLSLVGHIYNVKALENNGSEVKEFSKDLKFVFNLVDAVADPTMLEIYYNQEGSSEWISLEAAKVSDSPLILEASANHFTNYAVLANNNPYLISEPCDLKYNASTANAARSHATPNTFAVDMAGNGQSSTYGGDKTSCNGTVAIASVSGVVRRDIDRRGSPLISIYDAERDITVSYLHVNFNDPITVPAGTRVTVGQPFARISNLSTAVTNGFIHIHFFVVKGKNPLANGMPYNMWKFVDYAPPVVTLPDVVPCRADGSCPVYRFLNKTSKFHFYTIDVSERDNVIKTLSSVWEYEGPVYYAFTTQKAGTIPLYRFLHKVEKLHFYTANEAEKTNVISNLSSVWEYEGPAYYVYSTQVTGSKPVYRFLHKEKKFHFYTADETEKNNVINTLNSIWQFEGPVFYVPN